MTEEISPSWDVWYNNDREAFCRGQKVTLRRALAVYYGRDDAVIKKTMKDNDCAGCNMPIYQDDLYARCGENLFCLNCVTLKSGYFGHVAETVDQAQIRIETESGGSVSYLQSRHAAS